jgi:hypothetical protein
VKRTIAIAFTAALAFGCGKKADQPAAGSGTPPPTGSAATGSGSAAMTGSGSAAMAGSGAGSAAAAAVDVPTEMDFESQAKTDVTDKNVEAKVKAIEDQLSGK